MNDFNPTVIFTQFDNLINNINIQMHNEDVNDLEAEIYI